MTILVVNGQTDQANVKRSFYNTATGINRSGFHRFDSVAYLLWDIFNTSRAAGGVNGTAAEPGPGVRTVVDTENKLSISGGQAVFAGGREAPWWGDPAVYFGAITRTAGRGLLLDFNVSVDEAMGWGWATSQSGGGGLTDIGFRIGGLAVARVMEAGINGPIIASLVIATAYRLAIFLRSVGCFILIRGGSYNQWMLLFAGGVVSNAQIYPTIQNVSATQSVDNIRVSSVLWLPTPLTYDTFTRSDGAPGTSESTGPDGQAASVRTWTGATWTVSSNKAVNAPTVGVTNLCLNSGFDDASSWLLEGDWSIGSGVASHGAGSGGRVYQNVLTVGGWYQELFDIITITANNFRSSIGVGAGQISWVAVQDNCLETGRAGSVAGGIYALGATVGAVDNIRLYALTPSTLFSSCGDLGTPDVLASTDLVLTAGTQAGVVTNLDSAGTPANFLIAYHTGTNAILDKCVAGTYTNLISVAATYAASATLRLITYTSGGNLMARLYYNNALIGTEQTISDAGIVTNKIHGLFSTYSANTFDNYLALARGTEGQYAVLDTM